MDGIKKRHGLAHILGNDSEEYTYSPMRDEKPEDSASNGHQRAFCQQLADELQAAGAECHPDGEFFSARRGPGQH